MLLNISSGICLLHNESFAAAPTCVQPMWDLSEHDYISRACSWLHVPNLISLRHENELFQPLHPDFYPKLHRSIKKPESSGSSTSIQALSARESQTSLLHWFYDKYCKHGPFLFTIEVPGEPEPRRVGYYCAPIRFCCAPYAGHAASFVKYIYPVVFYPNAVSDTVGHDVEWCIQR